MLYYNKREQPWKKGISPTWATMKAFSWEDESKPEKYFGYENWWRVQNSKLVIFGIKVDG